MSPALTLLTQAAVMGAAMVLASLAFWRILGRRAAGLAVPAVVGLLSLVMFATHVSSSERFMQIKRDAFAALTPQQVVNGGAHVMALQVNTPFLDWVTMQIPKKATFFWEAPDAARTRSEIGEWALYRLLPRTVVSEPRKADWIIFYESNPKGFRPPPGTGMEFRFFAPTFAIARVDEN